jgi:hypothetical protein
MANTKITADNLDTLTTLTVDDITIDGSTISDAGDLTLDIGGDLTIDVDGADIKFADGGTEFADHFLDGSDYKIQTTISNGDFIIVGNDAGSAINALTLDISEGGAATFNAGATFGGNCTINTDTNSSLSIKDGGANAIQILAASADELYIGANDAYKLRFKTDGNIVMDNGGNVGIGTSSPDTKLHISDTAGGAIIRLERNDTTISSTNIYGGIEFEGQDGSAGSAAGVRGKILGVAEGATGEMALTFETAGGYGSSTERMRIDSTGIVTKPYTPAFSCNSSGNYTTTTGDQNIKTFASSNATSLNVGSHLSGGKFTAPVDGLYHFDLKGAAVYSSGYLFMYVFKNGSAMSNAYHYMYQTSNSATLSFTVKADAGDYFEPYINTNYSGGTVSAILFSGHLIG